MVNPALAGQAAGTLPTTVITPSYIRIVRMMVVLAQSLLQKNIFSPSNRPRASRGDPEAAVPTTSSRALLAS